MIQEWKPVTFDKVRRAAHSATLARWELIYILNEFQSAVAELETLKQCANDNRMPVQEPERFC